MAHRYAFILAIWGEKYISRFTSHGLPTQLAPGNLPALPSDRCTYHIFTRAADVPKLSSSASFQHLQQLMPTKIHFIDDVYLGLRYAAMTECHNRGIACGKGKDCAFVFLSPDTLWSDGSLSHMHQVLSTGKRAVLIAGPRVAAEQALPLLDSLPPQSDCSIRLSGRTLVDLILKTSHPLSKADTWSEGGKRFLGGSFHFDVKEEGILMMCPWLHPLAVRPVNPAVRLTNTLDFQYVQDSCPSLDDLHVVEDSDQLCVAEFSESDHMTGFLSATPLPLKDHIDHLRQNGGTHNLAFLRHRIRLHAGELSPRWVEVEQASNLVMDEIYRDFRVNPMNANRATPAHSQDVGTFSRAARVLRSTVLHKPIGTVRIGPLPAIMIEPMGQYGYRVDLNTLGVFCPSDDGTSIFHQAMSRLAILENGKYLGPPHAIHDVVRTQGEGAFSHWNQELFFSTSDNSDPRNNGRKYEIEAPRSLSSFMKRLRWRIAQALRPVRRLMKPKK